MSKQRFRAVVEYDGTRYHGFQLQAREPTVQGALEKALAAIVQEEVRVTGAGRTDAGVHAKGQVIHFDLVGWKHSVKDLHRALNALLPQDIVVISLAPASPDFHARFSALSREYRYTVLNQSLRSPLRGRFAYHFPRPLNVRAMNEAARFLIGERDFASFGQPTGRGGTVRRVYEARWTREEPFVHFDIVANAFLRGMVRSLVGTMLRVGTGELSPADFQDILQARDRRRAGPSAPPQGLCLMRVNYEDRINFGDSAAVILTEDETG